MHRVVVLAAVLPVLLAGCDRFDGEAGPPYTEGRSWILPGVFANATLYEEPDGSYRVQALAENRGDRTYRVSDACLPPWTDGLVSPDGERVEPREPVGHCAAFSLAPFPPGARREATFTWDGRIWDEGGPREAPAGAYLWNVTFEFFDGGLGDEAGRREQVALGLPVLRD